MREYIAPYLEHVLGNTWCIVTGYCRIPLYLADRSQAVMIDSGLRDPDQKPILELLEREKIHVAALLTSHFHRDHVGNHEAIKARHGCTIYMTPYCAIIGQDPANLRFSGYETYTMSKARGLYPQRTHDEIIPWEAESITVCGYRFGLIWLPGHAVEQLGFVTPDDVAYLSDTLLCDQAMSKIRMPYCTHCGLDFAAKESLRGKIHKRYILAHNAVCEEIDGLIDRNLAYMQERLAIVENAADAWMSMDTLCAVAMAKMGTDLNHIIKVIGAKRNLQVLIEHLVETGRLVARVREGYIEYIAANCQ